MTIRTALLVLAGLCLSSALRSEENSVSISDLNDATAFLAGMPLPHRVDHPLTNTSLWENHARQLNREFESHQKRVLYPMSAWSNAELPPSLTKGSTVKYLFSGPDILHAFHMFPTADTYIMCGLEPVGEIPAWTELHSGNAGRALGEVRNALGEIINFSFFRTKDMKEDLQFGTSHGITPILMIFLARSGQYIKSVEFLDLNKEGALTSKGTDPKRAEAVKIEFSPRRVSQAKTLYYFSSDLSDGGFPTSGFRTWLEAQPKGNSYLKAASFLMHQKWFKAVRQHLLDHSYQIVQDDSGIHFRYFDVKLWHADLFGTYNGPIDLFSEFYQGDLRAAYKIRKRTLNFGTGYKWRKGESNLMRFVRQNAPIDKADTEEGGQPAEIETKSASKKVAGEKLESSSADSEKKEATAPEPATANE